MKKLIFVALLAIISLSVEAQNFIDNHFPSYEDMEESMVVHISAASFDLAAFVIPSDASDEVDVQELVASVEALDVVAVDELENAASEFVRGINILDRQYEELLNYKEDGDQFSFYIDQDNEVVYELVGIGLDGNEFIIVSITGEMPLEAIGQVINLINSEKVKPVADLKTVVDITSFSLYPNPIKGSSQLNINVPEKMIGGTGYIYDMSGAVISKFNLTDQVLNTGTSNLRPGTYMVGLEKGDTSIKKQLVVVR